MSDQTAKLVELAFSKSSKAYHNISACGMIVCETRLQDFAKLLRFWFSGRLLDSRQHAVSAVSLNMKGDEERMCVTTPALASRPVPPLLRYLSAKQVGFAEPFFYGTNLPTVPHSKMVIVLYNGAETPCKNVYEL